MSPTMHSASIPRGRHDFHVAILCALTLDAECVIDALDHRWIGGEYDPPDNDDNAYTLGVVSKHNVVIIHMPGIGTVRAGSVVENLKFSHPNVELALVVGVCGRIPIGVQDEEILLGDVVISKALVRYDFGKQYPGGYKINTNVFHALSASTEKILGVLNKLETRQHKEDLQIKTAVFLQEIQQKSPKVEYPGLECDILYASSYAHRHHKPGQCSTYKKTDEVCEAVLRLDCETLGCDLPMTASRQRLLNSSTAQPAIHIGKMGCANTGMKSGLHRDALARKEEIIALKMKGAGV